MGKQGRVSWKQGLGRAGIPWDLAMTSGVTPSNSQKLHMTEIGHARAKMSEKSNFGAAAPFPSHYGLSWGLQDKGNILMFLSTTYLVSNYYLCKRYLHGSAEALQAGRSHRVWPFDGGVWNFRKMRKPSNKATPWYFQGKPLKIC